MNISYYFQTKNEPHVRVACNFHVTAQFVLDVGLFHLRPIRRSLWHASTDVSPFLLLLVRTGIISAIHRRLMIRFWLSTCASCRPSWQVTRDNVRDAWIHTAQQLDTSVRRLYLVVCSILFPPFSATEKEELLVVFEVTTSAPGAAFPQHILFERLAVGM